jgi:raffinose/stachyose/melibiose transport system substrate-binding protein
MNHITKLAGAALAIAGLAVAGCGSGGSSGDAAQGGKVALKLAIAQSGGTGESPIMPVIRDFQKKYPNVTVSVSQLPIDQYPQIVRTQLRSGTGPDIFYGSTGTGAPDSIIPLAKAGFAADLSGSSWVANVPKEIQPLIESNGKTVALPVEFTANAMIYNLDNFKKYGLAIPATFNDLLASCKTISSKGGVPIALAGGVPQNPSMVGMLIANNEVYGQTPDWNAQRAAGKVTFAGTAGWKQTMQDFQALSKSGCFQKGAEAAGFPQLTELLGSGKGSMVGAPVASIKTVTDSGAKVNLSAFAMPAASSDQTRLTSSPNYAFGVNSQSKHLDQAKQFLDFFSAPTEQRVWATARGDVSYADAAAGKLPAQYSNVKPYIEDKKFLPLPSLTMAAGVQEAMGKNMTGLLTGQVTVDQALQAMDQAWNTSA